jgi:hypothetical protein
VPTLEFPNARLRERGPRLTVRVSPEPEPSAREGSAPGRPAFVWAEALVDTGSGRSLIQSSLADELGLRPIGRVEVDTPSSTDLTTLEFAVRFSFAEGPGIASRVLGAPIPVPGLRVLLGRDVLARARLVYDGRADRFALDL